MLESATAGLEIDNPLPWDTHRLWSLWDMTNNFFFSSVNNVLLELRLLITTSKHNMKLIGVLGGEESEDLQDDAKYKDAVDQAIKGLTYCVETAPSHFSQLKCVHIDDAVSRLKNTPQSPFSWS